MSVSLSVFYPDLSQKESIFYEAATRVAMCLARQAGDLAQKTPPDIDVHFLLSGKFDAPDFKGMRIRSYDSKAAMLRVETAVPSHIVNSSNAIDYVVAAIEDALENASEFLDEIEMPFELELHFGLIDKIKSQLKNSEN